MSVKEAIETAMDVESKIRDLYLQAYDSCQDSAGKQFFAMLRDDEQYHHDYLSERLKEIEQSGAMQYPEVKAAVPSAADIEACLSDAQKSMAVEDRGVMQQILSNALKVEARTSEFYKKMAAESDGRAQKMFARFLEIEDGHIAAVQAELDFIMNTGYWFNIKEFDME